MPGNDAWFPHKCVCVCVTLTREELCPPTPPLPHATPRTSALPPFFVVHVWTCDVHLLLKGCYMPGEHTLILSVMCLSPYRSPINPHTQGRVSVCVCVWYAVYPPSNLCFGFSFHNFSPIWGGQVGDCLLTRAGESSPKGDLYSGPLEICLWGGDYGDSMVQSWGNCRHFLFIYLIFSLFKWHSHCK